MSIIIKGMKMPQKCDGYCPACVDTIRGETICNITKSVVEEPECRNPGCPLAELPPHGRLIDADALKVKFKEMGLGDNSLIERLFADGVYTVIDNAPTVIDVEADEEWK